MTDISVILPCRNEQDGIGLCIEKIHKALNVKKYEIIVADSSSDDSAEIAAKKGARVVKHNKLGYGNALLEGFKAAKGTYLVMADADNTYDLLEINKFLSELDNGSDLVIGSRFHGKMEKGAMPLHHRYIGNPMLSFLLRILYKTGLKDSHCGFRAFRKDVLDKMNLQTTGMEFASEMIIKAIRNNLKIKEIPINYYKRLGKSKLSSFADGFRHLRYMINAFGKDEEGI